MLAFEQTVFVCGEAKSMNTRPNHGQGPHSYYRAYLFSAANKIEKAIELNAATDAQATSQGEQLVDGQAVEVWDRGRKLIRFEARSVGYPS